MTIQQFARQRRLDGAALHIKRDNDVTTTALQSGNESNNGFESAARCAFGTTARRVVSVQTVFSKTINSPVGTLLLGASDEGLCCLSFNGGRDVAATLSRLSRQLKRPVLIGAHPFLDAAEKQLTEYFTGKRRAFDLPLHDPGTPFQRAVWSALRRIPFGRTWSYEQLAKAMGRPGAQRAVGTANGSNRIAIIIPCHRVVNKSGKVGGYGGGVWRKEFLLNLEKATPGW